MKTTPCEREQAVLQAIAAGPWSEDLRDHVAGCRSCSDAVLVAQALREAAADTAHEPLPDPGAIWRAAQRDQRLVTIERVTWPIRLMTRIALAAFVVAAAVGLVWFWPTVAAQASVISGWFSQRTAIDTGQVFTAILGFASLAAFSAAFALFESWARE
ncbi:MAG: hypothetical protein A2Y78_10825 [Acidobacteria bacterium RBG_13_68_16]|jgi:hypothetical protein|nr:MAG: hypothetical protein A2Y78_10825 [Acidobacteria bacterium RBG_13_68_16]